ncbi:Phage integrase family protein [Celeribacter indicus]|nr:Phage integrase family protein [Celeribacter indicus]
MEPRYSWNALVKAWRTDPRVQGKLSRGTKLFYRKTMDHILEKNGDKDVRRTTRAAVRAAHDKLSGTPRQADKYLQTIRRLWNYAKNDLDWPLDDNPAAKIGLFGRQREYEPWPEWMVSKLSTAPRNVQTTAELILGTGQRPGAAIAMKWAQVDGDWMDVYDEKGDEMFTVYCPVPLRAYLETVTKSGAHILARNLTEPLTYDGIASAFQKWRKSLGEDAKKYSLHGLRKLAIVRLAEAGCTDAQIQAVTNQSPEMVAYYRRRASRKILSKAAHRNE